MDIFELLICVSLTLSASVCLCLPLSLCLSLSLSLSLSDSKLKFPTLLTKKVNDSNKMQNATSNCLNPSHQTISCIDNSHNNRSHTPLHQASMPLTANQARQSIDTVTNKLSRLRTEHAHPKHVQLDNVMMMMNIQNL